MFSACVLIRTIHGKYEDVVKAISQIEGVKKIFPVLGRFDAVADIEANDSQNMGRLIIKLGRISNVVFNETLMEINQ